MGLFCASALGSFCASALGLFCACSGSAFSTLRNGLGPVGVFDPGADVSGDFTGGVDGNAPPGDLAGVVTGLRGTGGTVSSSGYRSRVICEKSTGFGELTGSATGDLSSCLPVHDSSHFLVRPRPSATLRTGPGGLYGWTYRATASSKSSGGRLVPRCTTSRLAIMRSMTILDAGAGPAGTRPPRCAALVNVRLSMYLHGPFLRRLTLAPCSDSVFTNRFTARSTSASDVSASFTRRCAGSRMGSAALYPDLTRLSYLAYSFFSFSSSRCASTALNASVYKSHALLASWNHSGPGSRRSLAGTTRSAARSHGFGPV